MTGAPYACSSPFSIGPPRNTADRTAHASPVRLHAHLLDTRRAGPRDAAVTGRVHAAHVARRARLQAARLVLGRVLALQVAARRSGRRARAQHRRHRDRDRPGAVAYVHRLRRGPALFADHADRYRHLRAGRPDRRHQPPGQRARPDRMVAVPPAALRRHRGDDRRGDPELVPLLPVGQRIRAAVAPGSGGALDVHVREHVLPDRPAGYGILEVASWFRGQPYAEPELLQFAARQIGRPATRHRGPEPPRARFNRAGQRRVAPGSSRDKDARRKKDTDHD